MLPISSEPNGRALLVTGHKVEIVFHIASELWSTASLITEDFKLKIQREVDPQAKHFNELELLLALIDHTLAYLPNRCENFPVQLFLKQMFLTLHKKYLLGNDPHSSLKEKLDTTSVSDALRIYYDTYVKLEQCGCLLPSEAVVAPPALFEEVNSGRASLLAMFGGQGLTEELLEELTELDHTYFSFTRPFLKAVTPSLLKAANMPEAEEYITKGLDILRWMDKPETRPPRDYLFLAAVSLPLVGITQLLNYYVTLRVLNLQPADLCDRFKASVGHSQGVVSAVVISKSRTMQDFFENSSQALQLLFWIGLRAMQVHPHTTLNPKILSDSINHGEGTPMPMLAVSNLSFAELQAQLDISNKFLSEGQKIEVSLFNGPRAFVCSGPPQSLYGLNLLMRKLTGSSATPVDQSRIPFSERKKRFKTKFLPISSPFHCCYLNSAVALVLDDIKVNKLSFTATPLAIPVIRTDTGKPIVDDEALMGTLVRQICVEKVHWAEAVRSVTVTHALDFGPGHATGIGSLTHKNVDGSGVQVILAGTVNSPSQNLQSRYHLFSSDPARVRYAQNWGEKYKPRLIRNLADGKVYVDTKFSRLIGKQPLMVAGMTPTTADADFVAACTNAGYYVELSGGAHFSERLLRAKINQVLSKVSPGSGISLNVLFINQRQWRFQFPLAQTLRQEGVPLEGFTIAAGVPSLEVANEILTALKNAGIHHVSFKPGSVEAIMQVVTIAKSNPDYPIVLQWTGGRAGGHHSFEDFHQPILETYSAIRSCPNLCLVGGSGFGDGAETYPYLDGSWSLCFDYPAMPFDGILLGSRMLVAQEAKTSTSAKETIVAAPGIDDEQSWVQTYKKPAGGIVTVISELGEPIHKVATRGVMLWKELDTKVFALPREKRLDYLNANKAWIIDRLNKDFQKVWFGLKEDGSVVDLNEMNYYEVAHRLAQLLWVSHQSRWIDNSYKILFLEFMRRVEERSVLSTCSSILPTPCALKNPFEVVSSFFETYPAIRDQLLCSEDCLHFIALCRRPGQKPVPFIPLFDENFENWFKKDSLWQSEDIDAVVGQDPERVCILQGPIAVKHAKKINEPTRDILDGVVKTHADLILNELYGADEKKVPTTIWFGGSQVTVPAKTPTGFTKSEEKREDGSRVIKLSLAETSESELPEDGAWLSIVSGPKLHWLRALLLSEYILQDKKIVTNMVRRLFRPRTGVVVDVVCDAADEPLEVSVSDPKGVCVVAKSVGNATVAVEIAYTRAALRLDFSYNPANSFYPIRELMEGRNERIKKVYWASWFDASDDFSETFGADPLTAVFKSSATIDETSIARFCRVVSNFAGLYTSQTQNKVVAPMDYAIVASWKSVAKCLFPAAVDGDLLNLVHLSNGIKYLDNSDPLCAGDECESSAQIVSITLTPAGKVVEVIGTVQKKGGKGILQVSSKFLYRGLPSPNDLYFEKGQEVVRHVLTSSAHVAVLKSKPWIKWTELADKLTQGSELKFNLEYYHEPHTDQKSMKRVDCTGSIYIKTETKEFLPCGHVDYTCTKLIKANPVLHYLHKYSQAVEGPMMFEGEGRSLLSTDHKLEVTTSSNNQNYSDVSGDHNPIHTNPFFADLAGLPGTITHGMWTSAAVRALIETYAGDNHPLRVTDYRVSFTGMVLPTQSLNVTLRHIGMKDGMKLIKVDVMNQDGEKVLDGMAEVEQPKTAYLFTGQGSQEVGMGMDLYASSKVAKEIWDQADRHFYKKFGFSILNIVRNNPKTLTVYFGGPRGMEIKNNYRALTYESVDSQGTLPVFPTISDASTSYTFTSPTGLLSATQFTQPALTLMEKAAYEDLKAHGLVNPHSPFAGHSLGEYAALAAVGDVLSIETLCDIVFYRGLTMQVAVKRDSQGRSQYGMVAVNPSRLGRAFTDETLRRLITFISEVSGRLLEIVNYNVENWQYVVAGDLVALEALASLLNYVHSAGIDVSKFLKEATPGEVLRKAIEGAVAKAIEKQITSQYLVLERGIATIPLSGIDVPFHSVFLRAGVTPFRKCLEAGIHSALVDVNLLRNNYIPNLTGVPFDVTKEYCEVVLKSCGSTVISEILENWTEENYSTPAQLQELARLLLIELLAFQFASPVRWIETQDELFKNFGIERLIEIGPSPVLFGMAQHTLRIKYQEHDDALNNRRLIWSYSKNRAEIYYQDDEAEAPVAPKTSQQTAPQPIAVATPAPVAVSAPVASVATSTIDVLPLETDELLQIIVGLKTKRPATEIPLNKSIKDLSGGKSTLQNEILADLQKEFGDAVPERSEEISLQDLSAQLRSAFVNTAARAPGKHTSVLISRLFGGKMPAGFGVAAAKDLLRTEFGLSPAATETFMIYCLSLEPASRLATEDLAKNWLRTTATTFFKAHNLELPSSGSTSTAATTSTISSVELDRFQEKHKNLLRQQIEIFASYVDHNLLKYHKIASDSQAQASGLLNDLDLWITEHGQKYSDGIKPLFSQLKTRRYDSYWNWACQDAFMLYYDIIFGRLKNVDRNVTAKCLHVMNRSFQHLVDFMEFHIFKSPEMADYEKSLPEVYALARQYGGMLIGEVRSSLGRPPVYRDVSVHTQPRVTISEEGLVKYEEVRRPGVNNFEAYVKQLKKGSPLFQGEEPRPFVYIRDKSSLDPSLWTFSADKTATYIKVLESMATAGVSFEGKMVLMTGCGKGSIGSEILKGLLAGGAQVVVTTSSFNRATVDYFRLIYECHGARSSALVVAPFNQGSAQDVEALVDYIYSSDTNKGLGWDLDYIIPFAAIPESGRELTDIDSVSELAHRIMLTNVLRILGAVARHKKENFVETRPAQVVLPLSPNHGIFGGDGMYGESKVGLETLFNRWYSESWRNYISIVGAVIGWTRGTGLMNDNNIVAEEIEALGVTTFSTSEMAFNILGLMHPVMVRMAEDKPVYGDLNGGMDMIPNLHQVTKKIREGIRDKAKIQQALAAEALEENQLFVDLPPAPVLINPRANLKFDFPKLPEYATSPNREALAGLLDLSQVVVVVGYGEVGPWGNSRTRWQVEADGELSLEGCIEMAWMMGMIEFRTGVNAANGQPFSSWVDVGTGEPVQDLDIKVKYEQRIMSHAGVRLVEPELFGGYDPNRRQMLQEIAINYDMAPLTVSKEEASQFQLMHGDSADVHENEDGTWSVKLKRGSTIYVPKALRFDRLVAGQIPTGWSAERYGIPKDIADQVDPVTLYVLVATAEALVSAGITDPYELYEYVHLSEVGNTSGGGEGGMLSNRKMFRDRFMDKSVASDVLQETFINTMPAWVNLLLLSSAGPIKTPVGACATAVESVEIGVETILGGKAKVVVVGGYDDFQEESSVEFANMKATSNAVEEMAKGREPNEMSRPTTTSRAGFMESQGAGIQVLMSADLAIQMGCPIYGVVALTNTATDKEGRSVPAPGQGILTTAKSVRPQGHKPRILDTKHRHAQLKKSLERVKDWLADELQEIESEASEIEDAEERAAFIRHRSKDVEMEAQMRDRTERRLWGTEFWHKDPRVSSIEGSLAVFGLTVDDIGVASFHGTGTKANDLNESEVVNKQMMHLGRTKGNLLPAVFQKHLTGHPKGAAAAWMLNGIIQSLNTGVIPGNRNADNIDEKLSEFTFLLYPSRTIRTTGLRAGMLKSFGFGQVGGEVVVVHPDYVFAALSESQLSAYAQKRRAREHKSYRYLHDAMAGLAPLVKVKTAPPFTPELESQVYLNPLARTTFDTVKGSWAFDKNEVEQTTSRLYSEGLVTAMASVEGTSSPQGVGVDVQLIADIHVDNKNFIERNFTEKERAYCDAQVCPQASYAGRWAAKEAVLKALCNAHSANGNGNGNGERPKWLKGAGGALDLIEVMPSSSGAPVVTLHGEVAQENSKSVKVSISHSGNYAVAFATVSR